MPDHPMRRKSDLTPAKFARRVEATAIALVFAVVIVVGLLGVLAWQVTNLVDDIERESRARVEQVSRESQYRAYVMCQNNNEIRMKIRTFLSDAYLAGRDGVSPGEQAVLDIAGQQFPTVDCPPEPLP